METDKNPFPKIELFNPLERVVKVARFIGERLWLCDSYEEPQRGAEAMLSEQLELDYGGEQ